MFHCEYQEDVLRKISDEPQLIICPKCEVKILLSKFQLQILSLKVQGGMRQILKINNNSKRLRKIMKNYKNN